MTVNSIQIDRAVSMFIGLLLPLTCLSCDAAKPVPGATPAQANTQITPAPAPEIYTLPTAGTKTLFRNISAHRDSAGLVIFDGIVLLPQTTKIVVDIFSSNSGKAKDLVDESKTTVDTQGHFTTGPFDIRRSGRYHMEVSSYFNGPWAQPADVIAAVGADGTKLPRAAIVPNDAEFPERGGHVDFEVNITVPPLSPTFAAIAAVKGAKLFVVDKGQAVDTVEEVVKFYAKAEKRFHPGKWSAQSIGICKWRVSLGYQSDQQTKVASWQYDESTHKVKYLDPEAKLFSWLPAE